MDYITADEFILNGVEPIVRPNALEEAAQRYWRASQMWRDKIPCPWTTGEAISEVSDLSRYRGVVVPLSNRLLMEIIRGDESDISIEIPQEVGN